MMCAAYDLYAQLYRNHAGHNSYYHLRFVRLARELINHHYRTCPQCAPVVLRSNFPQAEPRACDGSLTWKANRRGGRG